MKLDDVRSVLVQEHNQLRERLAVVRRLSLAIEKGTKVAESEAQLRAVLLQLRDELEAHCTREKDVLGPIIAGIDAWGTERAKLMDREHLAQHAALLNVLDEATSARGPRKLAAAAKTMARELGEHMEEEEKYLLHPEVLTDEIIKTVQLTD